MGLLRAPSALKTDWAKERKKSVKCTKNTWTFWNLHCFLHGQNFLENKIYTEKTRKLRQNTQKIANSLRYWSRATRRHIHNFPQHHCRDPGVLQARPSFFLEKSEEMNLGRSSSNHFLHKLQSWFNSKFNLKQNLEYSFQKIFIQ